MREMWSGSRIEGAGGGGISVAGVPKHPWAAATGSCSGKADVHWRP